MNPIVNQVLSHFYGAWRFRWLAVILAFLICLAGWTFVSLMPDKYESVARVSIDTSSVLEPLMKGIAIDIDPSEKVAAVTRTLLSRPSLEKLARATDLDLRAETPEKLEQLLRELHNDIKIAQPTFAFLRSTKNMTYYEISFVDHEPQTAQKVVQVVVDSLVEGTLGENRGDNDSAQRFLLDQIGKYEAQLKVAEGQIAEFKTRNAQFMSASGIDNGYFARLQTAIEQLDAARLDRDAALKRVDVLRKQLQGEIPLALSELETNPLVSAIAAYQTKLDELLLNFTEAHPDVERLRETIAQLKQRKEEEANSAHSLSSTSEGRGALPPETAAFRQVKGTIQKEEVEIASLEAEIAEKQADVERLRQTIEVLPQFEVEFSNLNRRHDMIKAQYVALLSRLEAAKLTEDLRAGNFGLKFSIVEPPLIPLKPTEPNRLLLHSGVLAAGLAVGAGFAFLLNLLVPVFLTQKELRSFGDFPVLGRVSAVPTIAQKWVRRVGYAAFIGVFGALLSVYADVAMNPEQGMELAQQLKEQAEALMEEPAGTAETEQKDKV